MAAQTPEVAFIGPLVVSPQRKQARFNYWLRVAARLGPGVTWMQARAELNTSPPTWSSKIRKLTVTELILSRSNNTS